MIKTAIKAAKEAGKLVFGYSNKQVGYRKKSRFDIQSEADLASEKLIKRIIKQKYPEHSFLAEESGEQLNGSEYVWVIDPVDGTINFSKGLDEYCISIALMKSNEFVLGVIYQPVQNRMYTAEKNKGAFLNGKKIKVSDVSDLSEMVGETEISSKLPYRYKTLSIMKKVLPNVRNLRSFGCSALVLAYVADGKFDFHFKNVLNIWDFAAGIVLVREAGGRVTDFKGKDFRYGSKDMIASNGKRHGLLVKLLGV